MPCCLEKKSAILIKREAHDIKKREKEENRMTSESHSLNLILPLFQTVVNYMSLSYQSYPGVFVVLCSIKFTAHYQFQFIELAVLKQYTLKSSNSTFYRPWHG